MSVTIRETALVLRTCKADLTSYGGFQWPSEVGAVVEAEDFNTHKVCGYGLHGWLHGKGDPSASGSIGDADAKWLVVEVLRSEIVELCGKIKFPRCTVRHIGDRLSATTFLLNNEPAAVGSEVIGAFVTAGYAGTATAGYAGTATAGNRGTATAGNRGTATAGNRGTATAGDDGTATAGYAGTATAGKKGELRIRYWDSEARRYRTAIAYVGEGAIEPNVAYKLDKNHNFVRA